MYQSYGGRGSNSYKRGGLRSYARGGSNTGGNGRRGNRYSRGGSYIDINKFINRNPEEVAEEIYKPLLEIQTLQINERLKANILRKGFLQLTPIQDQSIPIVQTGKDLIGIANTGTGKTAAFLIPLIDKVSKNVQERVLVIVPTRELAIQINSELQSLTAGMSLYSAVCIGGTNIYVQRRQIEKNHNFLICTPGRIKDLANRKWVNLERYSTVIVDEFDRMFDMGFQKDIHIILEMLPKARQSLFFSATISGEIEQTFNKYLKNPERVSINQKVSAKNIMQDVITVTDRSKKMDMLHDLLIKEEFKKVLVFIQTKWELKKIETELKTRGFRVEAIHGNKTQAARQKSLSSFKDNKVKILLATDVASRGLDISNVSHVINYDKPATYDDYIHRIGRTGRGGNKGIALTFV